MSLSRLSFVLLLVLSLSAAVAPIAQQPFDLVIAGGRVVDPESGLDAIRDVGIRGDRGVELSATSLHGLEVIDARGLVVAPGFIDLHRHAQGDKSFGYAARDGVTSVFDLELGSADVDGWYRMLGPARLVNFGVAAGHVGARMRVLGDPGFLLPTGPGRGAATPSQIREILSLVKRGLDDGAIAVGVAPAYTPGVTAEEIEGVFTAAASAGASVHAHLEGGLPSLQSALRLAASTGASLHIAHINSTAGEEIRTWLDEIAQAPPDAGVTTEVYPYTAGSTLIQSALYDGWESWPDERFARFQWAATGERLTRETFAKYRAEGGSVIAHSNTEDALRVGIADPDPIFASDGGRDLDDEPTHPRASGTFARVLGRYVRDQRVLTLEEALRRMTVVPARRLEARVPEMRDRGRLRAGAFADITVFDPARVIDRSTYTDSAAYSDGIVHVLVNGVPVVRDGDFDDAVSLHGRRVVIGARMPGRPIRAPHTP